MRVLKLRAVEDKTALKRTQLYLKIKAGDFPKQVRLGEKAVGWLEQRSIIGSPSVSPCVTRRCGDEMPA
jgi:prophage regulatory protein